MGNTCRAGTGACPYVRRRAAEFTMTTNALLSAHLRENHIAHTYLFTGPESETKQEMVLAFAKALNCEKGVGAGPCARPDDESESGQPRGGTSTLCSSCRKIEKRIHPDVRWLGEDEKARSIKIEEIRGLLHEVSLKPYEGKWKVFVLKRAERLTTEAANALLKTLEEPPAHSVFLLLVENKAHLLETIQSRAFEVRTPPLPEKDPLEHPAVRAFHEKGPGPFFAGLQGKPRQELCEELEALMIYLRNQCVKQWERSRGGFQTRPYVKALEAIYETKEAIEANVNQKLALTYLEIQLNRVLSVGAGPRACPETVAIPNKDTGQPRGVAPTFIQDSL